MLFPRAHNTRRYCSCIYNNKKVPTGNTHFKTLVKKYSTHKKISKPPFFFSHQHTLFHFPLHGKSCQFSEHILAKSVTRIFLLILYQTSIPCTLLLRPFFSPYIFKRNFVPLLFFEIPDSGNVFTDRSDAVFLCVCRLALNDQRCESQMLTNFYYFAVFAQRTTCNVWACVCVWARARWLKPSLHFLTRERNKSELQNCVFQ